MNTHDFDRALGSTVAKLRNCRDKAADFCALIVASVRAVHDDSSLFEPFKCEIAGSLQAPTQHTVKERVSGIRMAHGLRFNGEALRRNWSNFDVPKDRFCFRNQRYGNQQYKSE